MTPKHKIELIEALIGLQQSRKAEFDAYVQDLSSSLNAESKSTAGDKHETGRAMVHLEMEKAAQQLEHFQRMIEQLNRIQQVQYAPVSGFGSLITTDTDQFLLGIGLGKVTVNSKIIYCIGMDAPLARLLINKIVGDKFFFNNVTQTIKTIE
jgi:hypothetical protein